jgi:predicted Zn-dependent protease
VAALLQASLILHDPELLAEIEAIVAKIRDAARTTRSYRVHLVNSPIVNASAFASGDIVVFSGLIDKIGSRDELAFVLGHEMAHVELDHAREKTAQAFDARFWSGVVLQTLAAAAAAAAGTAAGAALPVIAGPGVYVSADTARQIYDLAAQLATKVPELIVNQAFVHLLSEYSQEKEFEADARGLEYMRAAHYDEEAAIRVQEMFEAVRRASDRGAR